jgi:hypothetical protein
LLFMLCLTDVARQSKDSLSGKPGYFFALFGKRGTACARLVEAIGVRDLPP